MKYIKRLVLWLFHRWFEVEIKPFHLSIDLCYTGMVIALVCVPIGITSMEDYKAVIGPFSNSRFAAIVNMGPGLIYIIVEEEAHHLDRLRQFLDGNGIITMKNVVTKSRMDELIVCAYDIKERRIG